MSRSYTIILPMPGEALRSNGRVHRMKRAAEVKKARAKAKILAKFVLHREPPPMWTRARMITVFRFPKHQHMDPTNCLDSLKAYIDGIQDAGIIADDKGLWPERPIIETKTGRREVQITIEPLSDAQAT